MSLNPRNPGVSVKRRTKIIITLGPATDEPEVMKTLIQEGIDLVRLNFSHGSHEEHAARMALVRKVAAECGRFVGILGDLQGPKIRISKFKAGKITLAEGDAFTLDAAHPEHEGDQATVGIDYKSLPKDVRSGDVLLLDDGRIKLIVKHVVGSRIECWVAVGGVLSNHKGINRMGGGLSAGALTEKDLVDIKFAVEQDVDYLAVSFPRSAEDMLKARHLIEAYHGNAGVIAKIERTEAVEHIDAIIEASDAVMVARGDLAVEIGDAEVPLVQKDIIQRARRLNKPVITATQMMESMITSTVPTRAEVSDVANAVLDYTDAVMLSAESAVGAHPPLVVAAMSRACLASERQENVFRISHPPEWRFRRIDEAIAMATMYTANHLDIRAIIALTESGATALWMSRIQSLIPIYALSRYEKTLRRMTLYRGVYPVLFDPTDLSREKVNSAACETVRASQAVENGDLVILTKGDHMGVGGGSNAMKILQVGEIL